MLNAKMRESIDECVLCWMATASKDGQPSVSPKQIYTHHGDDKLLIANIASPHSLQNVQENAQVCVSMVEVFKMRGFQYYGMAMYFPQGSAEYDDYHPILFEIAGSDFPILGVFCVTISKVKPVVSPSYKIFPERADEERIARTMREDYCVMPID